MCDQGVSPAGFVCLHYGLKQKVHLQTVRVYPLNKLKAWSVLLCTHCCLKKKKMDCWDLVWKGGFSVCSKIWAKSLWSDIREDLTHSLVEPSLRLSIQRQRSTMIWRGCRIQLWLAGRKQQYRGHQHISSDLLFIMCLNASCADTDRALNPLLLTAKFPVWTQC